MITRVHDEVMLQEPTTAHETFFFWSSLSHVYEYDAAEDGPECEVITRILARYPHHEWYLPGEKRALEYSIMLNVATKIIFLHEELEFDGLSDGAKSIVRQEVALRCARLGIA